VGFIGYRRHDNGVRVFLECSESSDETVSCTYPIDVIFAERGPRFEGVVDVFALKKFYKLVNSLEERAREQGRDREVPLRSPEDLVEHLRLTRNSREFTDDPPSRLRKMVG
jgi:hypothetical protein